MNPNQSRYKMQAQNTQIRSMTFFSIQFGNKNRFGAGNILNS